MPSNIANKETGKKTKRRGLSRINNNNNNNNMKKESDPRLSTAVTDDTDDRQGDKTSHFPDQGRSTP